nr:Hypothetical protein [Providencia alcalifaciens]
MKIYTFFILSFISILVFSNLYLKKKKSIKLNSWKIRASICYFYFMGFFCGDMYYSMKYGVMESNYILFIIITSVLFMNIIFAIVSE